ncbi:MAG: AMP-binding protein, partial [Candidatus Omnitrophota bacterium]
ETMGKVGYSVDVKIIDEQGNRKTVGEIGEILISGPTVMNGYYKREEETKQILKNGWCYSGDYGYFDKEGYLYFAGLKKNIAKVGGNMVDLVEVKNNICLFTDVIDTQIDTVNDEFWGNSLTAEVYVKNPKEFNVKKLRTFLRYRLSSYKIPRLKIAR